MGASCQALVFTQGIVEYRCVACSSYALGFEVLLWYRKWKWTVLTFISNIFMWFQRYIVETGSCSCLYQFQCLYFSKKGIKIFVLLFMPLPFNLTFITHITSLLSPLCCQVCDYSIQKGFFKTFVGLKCIVHPEECLISSWILTWQP